MANHFSYFPPWVDSHFLITFSVELICQWTDQIDFYSKVLFKHVYCTFSSIDLSPFYSPFCHRLTFTWTREPEVVIVQIQWILFQLIFSFLCYYYYYNFFFFGFSAQEMIMGDAAVSSEHSLLIPTEPILPSCGTNTHETLDDILFADAPIQPDIANVDVESNLLQDVAAASDICRCHPCRCDPLLNDCSVSCNPVVESEPKVATPRGCGCSCSSKPNVVDSKNDQNNSMSNFSDGCTLETPSGNDASQIKLSDVPSHSQDIVSSYLPAASDPDDTCCIVVCLKHLKQQYPKEKHHCFAWISVPFCSSSSYFFLFIFFFTRS